MKNAIIDDATGKVLNVIVGTVPVEAGQSIIPAGNCSRGDTWDGSTFIRATTPLPRAKADKKQEFITAGVARIAAQVPEWDTFRAIKIAAGMWPSLAVNATAAMIIAKDIYLYVKNTALPAVNALPTTAEVEAIVVTDTTPLPGAPWPT